VLGWRERPAALAAAASLPLESNSSSPHAVLLAALHLAVLPLKLVVYRDVEVARVLGVRRAADLPRDGLAVVDGDGLLEVKDSLLPMRGPAGTKSTRKNEGRRNS
jgi:hypothetical protein